MPLSEARLFKPRAAGSHQPLVKKLLKSLGSYMDPAMLAEIETACEFGAEAHQGQTRQSGEAYISHPVAVAEILGNLGMDSRTIVAAILHDVVEDTHITLQQIAEKFGEDVAHLVDGVSKVSQLEVDSRVHAEVASFRKMFMAMAQDIRVIIIKLCDRLHNMRTLGSLPAEKRSRIARQTLDIYAPIANRMGMRELSNSLEDLAMQTLFPKRFNAIQKIVRSGKRGRKNVIDQTCNQIRTALLRHQLEAIVEGREKSIYSIYRKAKRRLRRIDPSYRVNRLQIDALADINAIRIITNSRNDCYLALGIIHNIFKPRPAGFKDYIAIPKSNGYQSLHTAVIGPFGQTVEVQIRSRSMHQMAEAGVASHWRYKVDQSDESAPQKLAQKWLSSFMESQQNSGDSGEFIEHLKADLYPDEVYVFTPKGDIKRLPRDSTALDFAYAVHSDVGNRCTEAKINGRAVPLYEKLSNGDHVEVSTSIRARPRPGWLNYVVTSKARSSIRHYLTGQTGKQSVKLGQKLLRTALADQGYHRWGRIPSSHKILLLEALNLKDWPELLSDIGTGKRLAPVVAKQLVAVVMEPDPPKPGKRNLKSRQQPDLLTIEGTEGLVVSYAKCCYPIPDDRIIGTTTADRGLVIHRLRCPNSKGIMKHQDQFFHLNWASDTRGVFQVMLKLETLDQPGVLSEITNTIAVHESNINKLSVEEQAGNVSRMSFVIEVKDRKHLADIIRDLHIKPAVAKINRPR